MTTDTFAPKTRFSLAFPGFLPAATCRTGDTVKRSRPPARAAWLLWKWKNTLKNTAVEDDWVSDAGASAMLGENLERIEAQIAVACREAGRPRAEVALMAVSKMHPASAILAAEVLGIRLFGENRGQEFQEKLVQLGPRTGAEFHLIGHLQSNKAAKAVELFSSVDTIDSLSLAERLNQAAIRLGRRLAVLIEIKLSHEASKAGIIPDSDELRELLVQLPGLTALELRGLMTVPPFLEDPE